MQGCITLDLWNNCNNGNLVVLHMTSRFTNIVNAASKLQQLFYQFILSIVEPLNRFPIFKKGSTNRSWLNISNLWFYGFYFDYHSVGIYELVIYYLNRSCIKKYIESNFEYYITHQMWFNFTHIIAFYALKEWSQLLLGLVCYKYPHCGAIFILHLHSPRLVDSSSN